ncbi:MAG: hypothetical protein R2910_03355 [Gemmatimonadales bacterium]
MTRRSLFLPGLMLAVLTVQASGQEQIRPRGLWGRALFGMGHLEQSCDTCNFAGGVTAASVGLSGGYAWPAVAVGFELGAISYQGTDASLSLILLTVSWYPWPSSGAFVQGGVGTSGYTGEILADGVKAEEGSGSAARLGVGIDLSMGSLGVTALGFAQYAHQASTTEFLLFPGARNLTQWDIGIGVGLTVF